MFSQFLTILFSATRANRELVTWSAVYSSIFLGGLHLHQYRNNLLNYYVNEALKSIIDAVVTDSAMSNR